MKIKIVTMSGDIEFPDWAVSQVQNTFFKVNLLNQEGKYYYREKGIGDDIKEDDLLLFSFQNTIIASARYKGIKDLCNPPVDGVYNGYFCVKINTIKTFQPLEKSELEVMLGNFNIGQGGAILDADNIKIDGIEHWLDRIRI